jgi:peptidoglycan/xylan/chitin deacetylase (PgdA/CDA1 family)
MLEGIGLGALTLGAAGCAPITRIVHVATKCPQLPSLAPRASAPPPAPRRRASVTKRPARREAAPELTARAHEIPRLRHGEFVPGLYSKDTFAGQVAVSFDDMPKPGFTEITLRRLAEADVSATFFVVGRLVRRYPGLVKALVDAGHELGNHTYSHPSLVTLSPEEIRVELDRTQDAVDQALGYHYPLHMVRPPYGLPYYGPARPKAVERVSRAIANNKGCVALWSLGTRDTVAGCTPERVLSGLKRRFNLGTGGVMVFHPTYCAKGSLRPVFRVIESKGLRVASVRGLLEQKYGWPLETLSEWGPKLSAGGPATAKR